MLENFSKARILVIGDMFVDKYISGKITKISFESPIPIVEVISTELKLGGASLVIENAALLGAKVYPIGVVGNDEAGVWLKKRFKKLGVNGDGIITDELFNTPLRTRVTVEKHQVSRFDDSPVELSGTIKKKIMKNFERLISKVDCVIVCDYGMGVMTNDLIKSINNIVNKTKKKIIISPIENHLKYKNSYFVYRIKLKDAYNLLDIKDKKLAIEAVCNKLHALLKSNRIILTKGEEGLTIYENGDITDITPTHHISRDVTSVGEVLIATFAVSYASGESFVQSCEIGNVAAGTLVEKFGPKNITKEELENSLNDYHDFMMQK